jgi:hypothetical protein
MTAGSRRSPRPGFTCKKREFGRRRDGNRSSARRAADVRVRRYSIPTLLPEKAKDQNLKVSCRVRGSTGPAVSGAVTSETPCANFNDPCPIVGVDLNHRADIALPPDESDRENRPSAITSAIVR